MVKRRNALAASAAVLAMGAGLVPGVAGSAATASATAADSGQPVTVTLVTGDHARIWTSGGGTRVTIEPGNVAAPSSVTQFEQYQVHGDQYVVPMQAAKLIRDGVLDPELFNVSELVRDGYDDAHSANIPLLVRYSDAGTATAPAPPGAAKRRCLPAMKMAALDEKKPTAARFWGQTLTAPAAARGGASSLPAPRRAAPGIEHIWLNGKVHASLDVSVPQIGAPTAWRNGLTGTGVTVAVLDTGIDRTHPDFAGRVGPTKDFSGKGNVQDGFGHGTHVASIVAGSGAASDGRYKGVAPDAKLAIGKVLDDTGSGSFDAVIAGMQWAAADSGAKVVNMSLGAYPTDGTDPVSQALNDLTNRYGTLFVVAAGNFGSDEAVSSPASADKALAVASVSKSDVLSPFSSRGPRVGDGALKPEIAAPGQDIVAARAAGVAPIGEPVGDYYQRLSGTSMATPHVAGSAALLVQEHPDWSPARLRAALTSTAADVGASPYAVGTGRVDVARATTQPVIATGSLSTMLPWPNLGSSKTQDVTWHNMGTTPVTLTLSATLTRRDGTAAPSGLLTLSADTLTVPAGGDTSVHVTVTGQAGAAGEYQGLLSAHSADGAIRTRTALSVYQEEEKYNLTVNLIDRGGNPAQDALYSGVLLLDLDHVQDAQMPSPGETLRLPVGRYALHAVIATPRPLGEPTLSFVSYPELKLDHDSTYTLDARTAMPASIATDNPAVPGGMHDLAMASTISDCSCRFSFVTDVDTRFYQTYASTVPDTSSSTFAFGQALAAQEPVLELHSLTKPGFEVPVGWLTPSPPADQGTITAVYGGAGTPADLAKVGAKGKLVVAEVSTAGGWWDNVHQATTAIRDAGGKFALVIPIDADTASLGGGTEPPPPALPTMYGSKRSVLVQRFISLVKAGQTPASYVIRPFPTHRYELAYPVEGRIGSAQVYRPKTGDLVAVRTRYYDNNPDARHNIWASADLGGWLFGNHYTEPVHGGQERIEYFSPGTWDLGEQASPISEVERSVTLRSGESYTVGWDKAVAGPSWHVLGPKGRGVWRNWDELVAIPPMFSDSTGWPRSGLEPLVTGSMTLYRDGELVATQPSQEFGIFPMSVDAADYRLTVQADQQQATSRLSTTVSSMWTFRSSPADNGKAMPLVTVRFDPDVDIHNSAPGGQVFSFPAYVGRQDVGTVKAASLSVDVSYDDGQTWQAATVAPDGDHYRVTVQHPAGGDVSLRARATDADGNTVDQTVIRAYAIG